ncbi:MAG TPA: hypothetical protein PLY80_14525 [Pseudomonadota bacterium]|nr:hypothetical protein [Pseudomonadota bacterium]
MTCSLFRVSVLSGLVLFSLGTAALANNPAGGGATDLSRIASPPGGAAAAAIGRPIKMKAMLGVKLSPQTQTVQVGQPASFSVNLTAISITAPIALLGKTNAGRVIQFSPNPVQPGGTAIATLPASDSEFAGTYSLSVQASDGNTVADSDPATLTLTDPPCGSEPPKLIMTFPKVGFAPMIGNKAGAATFRVRIVNQGGRLPPSPTLRIMGLGSSCQYGHCLQGPGKPGAQVPSDNDFAGRGGCARLVFEADVPGQSLIPVTDCGVGSQMSKVISGNGYIPGVAGGGIAGTPTTITCAQMTNTP